jgi:DNA-binding XRE family transcriptional regulator
MPASRPMDALRSKAASLIIDRLKTVNVAQAASDLGVSRQAVYDIQKGKYCPSLSLVQKACEVWGLKFDFRGVLIDKQSFKKKKEQTPAVSTQMRLNLLEAISQLDYRSFEVIGTKPMGHTLEITLRLTIPEQKTGTTKSR